MEQLTVKDLIMLLEVMNPNAVVILSMDEEGNGYSHVDAVTKGEAANREPAVILWPGNCALG